MELNHFKGVWAMNNSLTFVATGDSFITRRVPPGNKGFTEIASLIHNAEVRFTNFEVTAHNYEGYPGAVSGGTWARTSPDVLEDIKNYGFNLIAWANNHTLDYTYGGLEATERYLNQYGFIHAGVGSNLAFASEPKYLETSSGRVALIAATSSFHETHIAGEQRPDMMGRPGINPLRYQSIHKISADKLAQLKEIAATVDINAGENLKIKEGFQLPRADDLYSFGKYLFQVDENEGQVTIPNERDMKRIRYAISEAKRQADYVLVSIHAHEMKGERKDLPAEFLETFSRACIDEGAHAVVGHGPHIVRGIEIYKSKPIFYSLGNFIFQNDTVAHLPADFYEKYNLEHTNNVADALDKRSRNNTAGFSTLENIWLSFIPTWKMKDGVLEEILLYPIELGFKEPRSRRGLPAFDNRTVVLEKLQELSEPYGTKIEIEEGIGKIYVKDLVKS